MKGGSTHVMNTTQGVAARSKADGFSLIEASATKVKQRGVEIRFRGGNSKGSSFSSIDPFDSVPGLRNSRAQAIIYHCKFKFRSSLAHLIALI